jgi:hypothetical protein
MRSRHEMDDLSAVYAKWRRKGNANGPHSPARNGSSEDCSKRHLPSSVRRNPRASLCIVPSMNSPIPRCSGHSPTPPALALRLRSPLRPIISRSGIKGAWNPARVSANRAAIAKYQDKPRLHFKERIHHISIPHNKFIVLVENGHPVAVWTGSTNITSSGFLGQSNVGHIVRDETVAAAYLAYFSQIAADTKRAELKAWTGQHSPNPAGSRRGQDQHPFQPRFNDSMLDWYGDQMDEASQAILLTSAFGVTPKLAERFNNDRDYLRYILMEQKSRGAGAQQMLQRDRDTRIVLGQGLGTPADLVTGRIFRDGNWRNGCGANTIIAHRATSSSVTPNTWSLTHLPMILWCFPVPPISLVRRSRTTMKTWLLIRGNQSVADIYTTEFFPAAKPFLLPPGCQQKGRRWSERSGDTLSQAG